MPPDDFFDDDWEEPSKTQDTAITRPSGEPEERARGGAPQPEQGPPSRTPRPPQRPRKPQRRGPQMPKMPKMPKVPGMSGGAASLPPLEYRRLAALGAGIVVIVLVLVLLARGCSGSSAKSKNETYVSALTATVLKPSDAVAVKFHQMFNVRRTKLVVLKGRLKAETAAMRNVKAAAGALKPTKQLLPYQSALLQALQLRVTGLQCLYEGIATAWKLHKPLASGQQLAPCTGRLLSSDYVYTDFFANGANAALKQLGATGVPTSQFLAASDVSLVTPLGIGQALQQLHPGPVHGLHGTQMGSVIASPQTLTLQPGTTNQVVGNSHLVFVVSVKNSGHFTEVGVTVQLKLKRVSGGGQTIVKTARIPSILAGQTAQVRFPGLFALTQTAPRYSAPYKLTVSSLKVPGEHVLSNNVGSYTVDFKVS